MPDDLDARLRDLAHRSLDMQATGTDVPGDWSALRTRLAEDESSARPSGRGRWFAGAAAFVLVVVGVLAIAVTRRGDSPTTARPPVTDTTGPPSASTPPPTTGHAPSAPSTAVSVPSSAAPAVPVPSSAPSTTPPGEACWTVPVAPPSLLDGSAPGAAVVADGTATWGGGSPSAVHQFLGTPPDPTMIDDPQLTHQQAQYGALQAVVVPVGDPGMIWVQVRDNRDGCIRHYAVGPGPSIEEARALALRWLIALSTGEPAGDPTPSIPVAVYGRRPTESEPFVEVLAFDHVAMNSAVVTDVARAAADDRNRLPDGSVATLLYDDLAWERCGNHPAVAVADDGTQRQLHAELPSGRTLFVVQNDALSALFVTRDVCREGAEWGDPGTYAELVRLHLTPDDALPVAVAQFPSDELPPEWAGIPHEHFLTSVDPSQQYYAFNESYAPEHSRYRVFTAPSPATSLDLATSCERGRSIVAPPQFVNDLVVVVRRCWAPEDDARPDFGYEATGNGELRLEAIRLPHNEVVWSGLLPAVELSAYSATIGLDATTDPNGRLWTLVYGIDSVENPSRGFLASDVALIEITQPGVSGFAFDPAELAPR